MLPPAGVSGVSGSGVNITTACAGLTVYGDELTALVGLRGVAHVVDELSANYDFITFLQRHIALFPLFATEVVDAEDIELGAVGIIGNINRCSYQIG